MRCSAEYFSFVLLYLLPSICFVPQEVNQHGLYKWDPLLSGFQLDLAIPNQDIGEWEESELSIYFTVSGQVFPLCASGLGTVVTPC